MTESKDAYVQKMKAKLDDWNAEIDKLAAKADQADAEAQIYYNKRIEELRAKRREFEDKIAALQQAGEGAWKELKRGLDKSLENWRESFAKAKSEFKRGYTEGREKQTGE